MPAKKKKKVAVKKVNAVATAALASKEPRPAMRRMTVIAQDPSVSSLTRGKILMSTITVPAEETIAGPIGYRVQVVDWDSTAQQYYGAHQLPDSLKKEPKAWKDGLPKIVDDYRFHAQNVYALVMKTLARFEFALGRRVGWSFKTHQLKVAPHGMVDANAFYAPQEEGLVFGYFTGNSGKPVYACLSHDVVVHETTHALLDALRERFLDPSSADQAAFHEGFSDVIALLSVFSQGELIERLLCGYQKVKPGASISKDELTGEKLRESALFGLAAQMGKEMQGARGEALRQSTLIVPDPDILDDPQYLEPHRRGEVFVAAVMNGFISAWAERIRNSGVPGQTHFPVAHVTELGAELADTLATMWIRAIDYMPPVHLEFPDALCAALTADSEVRPDDTRLKLRQHILESFKAYGISPVRWTGGRKGIWDPAPDGLSNERVRADSMRSDKDEVFRFLWENRDALKLRLDAYTEVLTVLPCLRVGPDGFTLRETVAQYYQVARLTGDELAAKGISAPAEYLDDLKKNHKSRSAAPAAGAALDADHDHGSAAEKAAREEDDATTPLYGGGALIFDEFGKLKYHIHNDVFGARQSERLHYLWITGQLEAGKDGGRLRATRLSAIHRLRAIDAQQFTDRGW